MAYNSYFPAGYQPAQIVYPQAPQMAQANQPQSGSIIWVQGEAGAKSYMVAPNNSVTLWDSESQTIYIKSANASGLPTMTILDYTIRDNTPQNKPVSLESDFATKDDISHLREEIDALKTKLEASMERRKEKKA